MVRQFITVFVLLMLIQLSFSMPIAPEIVEQLRASGQLEQIVQADRLARDRGVWEANPDPIRMGGLATDVDTVYCIIVLVDFSDMPYTNGLAVSPGQFDSLLFSNDVFAPGSMTDYYFETSYGQALLVGQVTQWYRMPQTYAYYVDGQKGFGSYPQNAQRLAEDAVLAADPDVDFSPYDNNGDLKVDGLFIVHAGPGYEDTGNVNYIHSHAWSTTYDVWLDDGVYVRRYSMEPEETGSGQLIRIGVFCHEFGHVLGLPDLYDYGYDSDGVGYWSVMASGSWGDGGRTPVHFDAWSRMTLGWVNPTVPNQNLVQEQIDAIEYSPDIYLLYSQGVPMTQYFMVENRRRELFDAFLPGSGLLIYHVDDDVYNNNDQTHYHVAVEQADGQYDLENNLGSDAGDPWPGTSNNRTFDDFSVPNSGLYNLGQSEIAVSAISNSNSIMFANLFIYYSLITSPAQNELNVAVNANISVTFGINMNAATINSSTFLVNGMTTGSHDGMITYDNLTKTALFDPTSDFANGEIVTVILTEGIESSEGIPYQDYIWSFITASGEATGTFEITDTYSVGEGPKSIFASDLDGDGDSDLAVANGTSDNVSILKNNGNGTYQAAVNYGAGDGPMSVFAADLDGDGDSDLAVANAMSDNVSILKNDGDGTYQAAVNYGAGDGPYSVFAADLDGDGDSDLAVANWNSDNVSILKNSGDGTYQAAVNYGAGNAPISVFAADLDGDGDSDLAAANYYSDNVSILINYGDGTYQGAVNYGAGADPHSVFAADLDGDGDIDLAVAISNSANVSILKNNGDGTYEGAVNYGTGDAPFSVFAADLDGDGDSDLAVANYYSDNISILKNSGDGTYQAAVNYGAGDGAISVFAADFDGDEDMDLATANFLSNDISILMNIDIPGIISGIVINDGLTPVNGVNVMALGTSIEDFTNQDGEYELDGLNADIYDVSFSHPDYRDTVLSGIQVISGETITLDIQMMSSGCEYLPGDVNMSGAAWPSAATGPDVTYLVNYFRSLPTSHACLLNGFWASADANGDCNVIGSDVTKLVNVFRGIGSIGYCPSYPPMWLTPADLPEQAPEDWPGCD